MRGTVRGMLTLLLLACSLTLLASGNGKRLTYSVDAATTNPPATVTKNGQGITVVIFKVANLDEGGTFTFTASLGVSGKNLAFPLDVDLSATSKSGLTVTFDPATVTFPDSATAQTSTVTVTLAAGAYSQKRIQTTIKGAPASGSGLGKGSGIKVVITEQASAAATAEEQMLQDVNHALAPEPEAK